MPSPAVFCIRSMYFLLTVFHAVIYFSIHAFKHFSSRDDNELPGDEMHLSKQWLFIFWEQMAIRYMGGIDTGETQDGALTDINDRALLTAASCWTCLMSAVLGSEEALIAPLKESMIVIVGRSRALRLLEL